MKYSLFVFVLLIEISAFAQEVRRQTVAISGKSTMISYGEKSYYVQSSIGQASVIGYGDQGNFGLRQGFIQPMSARFVRTSVSTDLDALIFPNPCQIEFNVRFTESLDSELLLYDLTGRLLKQLEFNDLDLLQIDVSEFPSGTYTVYIRSSNKTFIGKVIKY